MEGFSRERTGLCLAACQTLFSRGWKEGRRVGEEQRQFAKS